MNIERAERFYDFLYRLPPHRIDMRQTMSRCGTSGCWAGWASYFFEKEVPIQRGEVARHHAARALEMSEVESLEMYNATWEGSPGLLNVDKYQLLAAWRRCINTAKREQATRQAAIDALLREATHGPRDIFSADRGRPGNVVAATDGVVDLS